MSNNSNTNIINFPGGVKPTELISVNGNTLTTTSLQVAEVFGRQHKNVLAKVESLECSKEFNELNFKPVEYLDGKGEKRPSYEMTKDGFMFLVMGFTGKKAAQIKEAYINAFNFMAEKLFGSADKITDEQQREIQEAVAARLENIPSEEKRKKYGMIYGRLKNKFRVPRYQELRQEDFEEALDYIDSLPIAKGSTIIEGEVIGPELNNVTAIHAVLSAAMKCVNDESVVAVNRDDAMDLLEQWDSMSKIIKGLEQTLSVSLLDTEKDVRNRFFQSVSAGVGHSTPKISI